MGLATEEAHEHQTSGPHWKNHPEEGDGWVDNAGGNVVPVAKRVGRREVRRWTRAAFGVRRDGPWTGDDRPGVRGDGQVAPARLFRLRDRRSRPADRDLHRPGAVTPAGPRHNG